MRFFTKIQIWILNPIVSLLKSKNGLLIQMIHRGDGFFGSHWFKTGYFGHTIFFTTDQKRVNVDSGNLRQFLQIHHRRPKLERNLLSHNRVGVALQATVGNRWDVVQEVKYRHRAKESRLNRWIHTKKHRNTSEVSCYFIDKKGKI